MRRRLEVVFLDVGGPIYDDYWYAMALLGALRELGAQLTEEEYWDEVYRCRLAQAGMTGPLTRRFLGKNGDPAAVSATARRSWHYPPDALYDDVLPTLERLSHGRRLGLLANQPDTTRAALERDGVAAYVDLWVISDEIGFNKPDPRIFRHAVTVAGCPPDEVAYVGNRLDNDIRPARAAGLRTIWVLRGEAPAEPTDEQRGEADAVVANLAELPAALDRLELAG